MLGGADNPNGELPSYITGADITAVRAEIALMSGGAFAVTHHPVSS